MVDAGPLSDGCGSDLGSCEVGWFRLCWCRELDEDEARAHVGRIVISQREEVVRSVIEIRGSRRLCGRSG